MPHFENNRNNNCENSKFENDWRCLKKNEKNIEQNISWKELRTIEFRLEKKQKLLVTQGA